MTEPTHEQKIEAIVLTMADWELDDLLNWAMDTRRDMLRYSPVEVVELEYKEDVLGEFQEDL